MPTPQASSTAAAAFGPSHLLSPKPDKHRGLPLQLRLQNVTYLLVLKATACTGNSFFVT